TRDHVRAPILHRSARGSSVGRPAGHVPRRRTTPRRPYSADRQRHAARHRACACRRQAPRLRRSQPPSRPWPCREHRSTGWRAAWSTDRRCFRLPAPCAPQRARTLLLGQLEIVLRARSTAAAWVPPSFLRFYKERRPVASRQDRSEADVQSKTRYCFGSTGDNSERAASHLASVSWHSATMRIGRRPRLLLGATRMLVLAQGLIGSTQNRHCYKASAYCLRKSHSEIETSAREAIGRDNRVHSSSRRSGTGLVVRRPPSRAVPRQRLGSDCSRVPAHPKIRACSTVLVAWSAALRI